MIKFARWNLLKRALTLSSRTLATKHNISAIPELKLNNLSQSRNFKLSNVAQSEVSANRSCWKCAESVRPEKFFCDSCNVLQKSNDNVDYFQLFGVDASFEVNEFDLATKFKKMQMILHPDKFSMKSPEELAVAEEYSSLINKAYSVLKEPWSRGVYLLNKFGIYVEEETTVKNPNLLSYVMERNEAVAAAKEDNHLLRVDVANKADIGSVVINITKAFDKADFQLVKDELVKLKYFVNIDKKINERKLEFGIME